MWSLFDHFVDYQLRGGDRQVDTEALLRRRLIGSSEPGNNPPSNPESSDLQGMNDLIDGYEEYLNGGNFQPS